MGAAAAFAFSRMRFKGRRPGLLGLVLVQMFPAILALTAIFLLLTQIRDVFPQLGLGTICGLILVYLGGTLGVNTYLMKGFFDTIPVEIDESARIDGASHVRIFFGMILRLAAPILIVVFFVTFTGMFNELAIASVIVPDQQDTTLAVGLNTYVSNPLRQEWGLFAAGARHGSHPDADRLRLRTAPAGHRPHRRRGQGLTRGPHEHRVGLVGVAARGGAPRRFPGLLPGSAAGAR